MRMPMQAWKQMAVAHMFSIRPRVGAMPLGILHLLKKSLHDELRTSAKLSLRQNCKTRRISARAVQGK